MTGPNPLCRCDAQVAPGPALSRPLRLGMSVLLACLNIAVVTLYGLWSVADEWAADRSEATHGFDPSMLLPNSIALWLAANATIVVLIALDIVWISVAVTLRSAVDDRSPAERQHR